MFTGFYCINDHTSFGLENFILNLLEEKNINLSKCRGQGYDGANVMSGVYNGLQARIIKKEPTALFVHCAQFKFSFNRYSKAHS